MFQSNYFKRSCVVPSLFTQKGEVFCDLFFGTQNKIVEHGNNIFYCLNEARQEISINNNV